MEATSSESELDKYRIVKATTANGNVSYSLEIYTFRFGTAFWQTITDTDHKPITYHSLGDAIYAMNERLVTYTYYEQ